MLTFLLQQMESSDRTLLTTSIWSEIFSVAEPSISPHKTVRCPKCGPSEIIGSTKSNQVSNLTKQPEEDVFF